MNSDWAYISEAGTPTINELIEKIKNEFAPHVLINTCLAKEIINLVEQSQWIKVSDRLPENESILCMIYARDYYEFGWWHEGTGYWDSPDLGYIEKDEVTWWQPIPSPPE